MGRAVDAPRRIGPEIEMDCNCGKHGGEPESFRDLMDRVGHEIEEDLAPTLDYVVSGNFLFLYRCRVCGALWVEARPFGEGHGGGPPMYYRTSTETPTREWLEETLGMRPAARRQYKDWEEVCKLATQPEWGRDR